MDFKNERNYSAFYWAAREGHDDIIEILLQHGQDINVKGGNDLSPISRAAASGHRSTVKMLGEKGALLDLQDADGDTALLNAVGGSSDNPEVVAELLMLGADPTIQNNEGLNAEQKAKNRGKYNANKILQSWQNPEVGRNMMMLASMSCNSALAKALKMIGVEEAEFTLTDEQIKNGETFVEAVKSEDLDGARNLIAEGLDIDWLLEGLIGGEELNRKLLEAARDGDIKNVLILLFKGVNMGYTDSSGDTAFNLAAENGHDDILSLFVQFGHDINVRGWRQYTPIMSAAYQNRLDSVKLLASLGAKLDLKNSYGNTVLGVAANDTGPEIVAELLMLGVDPSIKNNDNKTAEQIGTADNVVVLNSWQNPDVGKKNMKRAAMASNKKLVNALSIIGVEKIDYTLTEEEFRVGEKLIEAATNGDVEGVTTLIDEGADTDYLNENGETAFKIAAKNGHGELVKLFLERGQTVHKDDFDGATLQKLLNCMLSLLGNKQGSESSSESSSSSSSESSSDSE